MADGTNAMIAVGHRQGDTLRLGPADQENGCQRIAFVNSFQIRVDMRIIPRKERQITGEAVRYSENG
jgi:hypothetical protein